MSWTDERVERLKKLYAEGVSASQIAKHLGGGVSRNAVIGKVHRLGLDGGVRQKPSAPRVRTTAPMGRPPKPKIAAPATLRVASNGSRTYELPDNQALPPLREVVTGVEPKPWLQRGAFECTWIVRGEGADPMSCCAPVHAKGWCAGHHRLGHVPAKGWFSDKSMEKAFKRERAA